MTRSVDESFGLEGIDAALPSRMLAEPSRSVTPRAPSDPARLGYPPTFPVEIALRTSSTRSLCEAYGIDEDEWELIRHEPLFLADLKRALEMLQQEGMSFKVKARLQAESLLQTSWREIHSPETPPAIRAKLIEATVRWAGWDSPAQGAAATTGNGFSININLNGAPVEPRIVSG
jgi:hypothetical protein